MSAFVGLRCRHGSGRLTRAVMEGVVFSLKDSFEIIRQLGVPIEEVPAVGGGARSVLWRQLQADIYGEPIYRTEVDEGPAYGAALLGGIAAGVYSNVAEARSVVRMRDEVTEPEPERTRIYEEYHQAYRSRYPAQKDAMQKLSDLAAEHG